MHDADEEEWRVRRLASQMVWLVALTRLDEDPLTTLHFFAVEPGVVRLREVRRVDPAVILSLEPDLAPREMRVARCSHVALSADDDGSPAERGRAAAQRVVGHQPAPQRVLAARALRH